MHDVHDVHDVHTILTSMPKPPTLAPKKFQRKLTEKQLSILLAAGAGNTTKGLDVVLNCYQLLFNAGIKNDDKLALLLSNMSQSNK